MAKVTTKTRYVRWERRGPVTRSGANAIRGNAAFDLIVSDIKRDLEPAIKADLDTLTEDIATKVLRTAKELAPVSGPGGGDLRRSLSHAKVAPLWRRVWTDIYYAPFQEFGTTKHGPQPFMLPAAKKHAKEFLDGVKRIMRR